MDDMSTLRQDEVHVRKHLKMASEHHTLSANNFGSSLGVWLNRKGENDTNCFGIYADERTMYVMFYPPREYFKGAKNRMPFAFGVDGLQLPKPDGTIVTVPLSVLAEMAETLMEMHKPMA